MHDCTSFSAISNLDFLSGQSTRDDPALTLHRPLAKAVVYSHHPLMEFYFRFLRQIFQKERQVNVERLRNTASPELSVGENRIRDLGWYSRS